MEHRHGEPGWVSKIWLLQAVYYATTGVWPLAGIRSFQAVTGPKTDLWLVKTVGVLVLVIGSAIALAGYRRRVTPEIRLLGMGSAAALAAIDAYYVARGRIARIYLADAVANLGIIAAWALWRSGGRGDRSGAAGLDG